MIIDSSFIVAKVNRESKARCLVGLKYNDIITLEYELGSNNQIKVYINGKFTGFLYGSRADVNLAGYVLHRVSV